MLISQPFHYSIPIAMPLLQYEYRALLLFPVIIPLTYRHLHAH